jgi:general secretion pathway protein C
MASSRQRGIVLALVFASVALSGIFCAQGATALIALFVPLDAEAVGSQPAAVRAGSTEVADNRTRDATQILTRNIFDSETGNLLALPEPEAVEVATTEPAEIDPNAPLPRCDGAVRLVGSLVNSRHPEWSFAAITGAAGTAMLYRPGMSIDGREVVSIASEAVVLRPGGTGPCELAMFAPPATSGPGPVQPATVTPVEAAPDEAPAAPTGAISASDMDQGITRVSDTQYTVARNLVDQLLENQAELMRTARIIPHQENGRTVGVKLYGIRRNSLLGRLGIQNGDMLRTINGYDMSSPDSALEAYARLRSASNLSVSVVRRGQPTTLEYTVQ